MTKATKNKRARKPRSATMPPVVAKPEASRQARCPPPEELDKSVPNLKHVGGSKSDIWNQYLANQAMRADWYGSDPKPGKDLDDQKTAVLAFLVGVKPTDVIEGMMAAQLFASHAAAMDCYRRAMLPGQTDYAREMNLTHAAKLTRANAAQVEALAKHRNKGKQKITIEHVHVYQGGQAAFIANGTPGEGVGKIGKGHATNRWILCGATFAMQSYSRIMRGRIALRRLKEAGGATPGSFGLTMGRLLDRTFGVRPRASRIVHALGLDQPSIT